MTGPLKTIWAFIDESGNLSLDIEKEGVSNLYVCAAIRIEADKLEGANQKVLRICHDEFNDAEIKSSRIGGKHNLRLKILKAIQDIDFSYLAIIVDKPRLYKDSGFRFPRTFYKYFHRFLHLELLKGNIDLHIKSDKFGRSDFQDSFKNYLNQNVALDLYTRWDHSFGNSIDHPMIQLADLIAGSLTYCFDPEKKSEYSSQFRQLLKNKELRIHPWPLESVPIQAESVEGLGEFDEAIREHNLNEVLKFRRDYEDSDDEDRRMQVAILVKLLLSIAFEEDEGAIVSQYLIEHLHRLDFTIKDDRELRQAVIGPLRDYGILITGRQDGYRLATKLADIDKFIHHDSTIIIPMLNRLRKARELILQYTNNQKDILQSDQHIELKRILDSVCDLSLDRMGSGINQEVE